MGAFDGQVVLVTGGARGMGANHALAFARAGADVVLVDRCQDLATVDYPLATPDDLARTAAAVEAAGRRCLARQGDVRRLDELAAVVDETRRRFGRLDVLVANAGVSGGGPVHETTPDAWDEVIGCNLTGVFTSMRAVAPTMMEQRRGRIVAISSMMGRGAVGGISPYVASKWGVIGLVKSAAQDLAGFGITVNAVAPGNVDTPMVRNPALARRLRPDLAEPTLDDAAGLLGLLHVQPQALLHPDDVTAAVLFLAGDGASHVTGAVIDVSAGASARVTA